jgi:hypothetical protein
MIFTHLELKSHPMLNTDGSTAACQTIMGGSALGADDHQYPQRHLRTKDNA